MVSVSFRAWVIVLFLEVLRRFLYFTHCASIFRIIPFPMYTILL